MLLTTHSLGFYYYRDSIADRRGDNAALKTAFNIKMCTRHTEFLIYSIKMASDLFNIRIDVGDAAPIFIVIVKNYQPQLSLNGLMIFSKPAVLKTAVTKLLLYKVT